MFASLKGQVFGTWEYYVRKFAFGRLKVKYDIEGLKEEAAELEELLEEMRLEEPDNTYQLDGLEYRVQESSFNNPDYLTEMVRGYSHTYDHILRHLDYYRKNVPHALLIRYLTLIEQFDKEINRFDPTWPVTPSTNWRSFAESI